VFHPRILRLNAAEQIGPNDQSTFYIDDTILPAFLDDLRIQTNRVQKVFCGPRIGFKTIGGENEWVHNSTRIDNLIEECFDILVIAAAYNLGNPHPGPDLDCYEYPHWLRLRPDSFNSHLNHFIKIRT